MNRPIYPRGNRGLLLLILSVGFASCEPGGPLGSESDITLSASSLNFSIADDQHPVTIRNLGSSGVDWKVQSTTASWVTVAPGAGSVAPHASERFEVIINRGALSPGNYDASLQLKIGDHLHPIHISIQQGDAPTGTFLPGSISLGPADDSGVLKVANTGGSTLSWTITTAVSWARVNPSSGTTPPGGVTQVAVVADRSGLTKGTYAGLLFLTSNAIQTSAAISMEVGAQAMLRLDSTSLNFGLSEQRFPIQIVNDGHGSLSWTASSGAGWLSMAPMAGSVPPRSTAQLMVNVNRGGLSYGLHQAALHFSSNGGSAALNVSVNASPSGSVPSSPTNPSRLEVAKTLLDFGYAQSEISLVVHNSGDATLEWTGRSSANWVTVLPPSGRVSPHADAPVIVKVLRDKLGPGAHQTTVHIDSDGGSASVTVRANTTADGAEPSNPAPEPSPTPGSEPALISVSPSSLDFGDTSQEMTLVLQNKGGGVLDWNGRPASGWILLSASSGRIAAGASQTITVRANRSDLAAAGQYQSSVDFTSNGGNKNAVVLLRVPTSPAGGTPDLNSIDATGGRDVTEELNAYLASVPNGSVVHFPAGARYRVEGVVRLIDRENITIEGNGALLFATTTGGHLAAPVGIRSNEWPRTRAHLRIDRGRNIVIRDLTIRGVNPNAGSDEGAYNEALEGQHGVAVRGVAGLTLENVTITDTYGDFLYLGNGSDDDRFWSTDIVVRGSHFERSGRQGIAITAAQRVLIEDSYIGEVGRSILDIEPNSAAGGAVGVTFTRVVFGPCRHLLLSAGGKGPNVRDIKLIGNTLRGMELKVLARSLPGEPHRAGFEISGNRSDTPSSMSVSPIRFLRVDDVTVTNNFQSMNPAMKMIGVYVCETIGVRVEGNAFPGSVGELDRASNCPEGS